MRNLPAEDQKFKAPGVMLLVLALLSSLAYTGLSDAPLIDWDENIYAEAARQMFVRGDYLVPHINGQPFAEKPPFFFWITSIFFSIFGPAEFAARSVSAFSHLLFSIYLALRLRAYLGNYSFFYAMLYAGAFGPLLSARFAVIDNMFNGFIGVAAFELFLLARAGKAKSSFRHAALAALAMGTGVLTKGPLAGVIPLVAYSGYKVAELHSDGKKINPLSVFPPLQFLLVGLLSLAIASSWYVANYLKAGPSFLAGFAAFQGMLFSQPLDSHEGPFFYHFIVALVGLFPWTPLLLLYASREIRSYVLQAHRPLVYFCLTWIAFVLLLFSIVSTKLPHYSASMYIPLTLLLALALKAAEKKGVKAGRAIPGISLVLLALAAAAFIAIPYSFPSFREKMGFVMDGPLEPHALAFLPGLLLFCGGLLMVFYFYKEKIVAYLISGLFTMAIFLASLWILVLPLYTAHNQGPLRKMMQEVYARGGDLAMYRFLSFAVFFYGQREVLVLHSYKFKGDASRLNTPGKRDLFVLCRRQHGLQLTLEHPRLKHVKDLGLHSLYVLEAADRE